jgi:hypothetical protein
MLPSLLEGLFRRDFLTPAYKVQAPHQSTWTPGTSSMRIITHTFSTTIFDVLFADNGVLLAVTKVQNGASQSKGLVGGRKTLRLLFHRDWLSIVLEDGLDYCTCYVPAPPKVLD